ncbi:endonuclease domain-containing protein [Halalkalibaculum sp. DA384]|uniref:endonuclease domain-containing protein n=1 Tax=Halalkalibaculum sp. DA384 TaxID=3373606 RepID=UPI00375529D9
MARNEILPYNPKLKPLARKLRRNMTFCEVLLWQKIRKRALGVQLHRQVPILDYIVDFYCHELKLAIEVDGVTHLHPEVSVSDLNRQKEIEKLGVHFLRFEDMEIKENMDEVMDSLEYWINKNT